MSGWIQLSIQGPLDEEPVVLQFANNHSTFLGPQAPRSVIKRMRVQYIVAHFPAAMLTGGKLHWSLELGNCRTYLSGMTTVEQAYLKRGVR